MDLVVIIFLSGAALSISSFSVLIIKSLKARLKMGVVPSTGEEISGVTVSQG